MYNVESCKAKARRGFAVAVFMAFACVLALIAAAVPVHTAYAGQTEARPRVINVAYDDSGSMDQGKKAWCQAHYALEVFANMLDENDVLNVFTMSDAEAGKTSPCLTIYGSASAKERVDQAHAIFSQKNSSTPYDVVINAKNHLDGQNGEAEHWLVILTDGAFTEYKGKDYSKNKAKLASTIQSDLTKWASAGTNIEYVALGSSASSNLPADAPGLNVNAIKDGGILDGIVNECKVIFGMAPLDENYFDAETGTLKMDLPMGRVIVFAQGQNTTVGSMTLEDGTQLAASELSTVMYTEKPHREMTSISKSAVVDRSLQGTVATFINQGGFQSGTSTVDVSNAQNVTIYFEPYVNMETTFTSKDGKKTEVLPGDTLNLKEGSYQVSYRLLDPFTGEEVSSPLITSTEFSAGLAYDNGEYTQLSEGESVEIKEGTGALMTSALINGDVELRQEAAMSVMPKSLDVEVLAAPKETIPVKKLNESDPFKLRVTKKGAPLSQAEWDATEMSVATSAAKDYSFPVSLFKEDTGLDCEVIRGDAAGTYLVYLKQHNNDPVTTVEGNVPLTFTATFDAGYGKSFGEAESSANIEGLSLLEKILSWILRHWWLLILLFLLALLIAFLIMLARKPRLPKINPEITLDNNKRHGLAYDGQVQNRIWPPWAPERTSFTVQVEGVAGDPYELRRRFPLADYQIGLVAEKKSGGQRRFRLDDETIAAMQAHMGVGMEEQAGGRRSRSGAMATTGIHPNPKYSCVGEGMNEFDEFGGQIRFKGYSKNRRGDFENIQNYKIDL